LHRIRSTLSPPLLPLPLSLPLLSAHLFSSATRLYILFHIIRAAGSGAGERTAEYNPSSLSPSRVSCYSVFNAWRRESLTNPATHHQHSGHKGILKKRNYLLFNYCFVNPSWQIAELCQHLAGTGLVIFVTFTKNNYNKATLQRQKSI